MMRRRSLVVAGGALAAWAGAPAWAQPRSAADALMARVDKQARPAWEVARVRMELQGEGSPLVRELDWYFVNDGAQRTSLMKFRSPANVQSVGLMVVEEAGKTNAIWHYLPATRNVRRISAEHRQNRFMGTEFVFEDFEGLKLDKYRFESVRSEACRPGGEACQVVEAVAADAQERDSSSYARKLFWIGEHDVIVRTELFDRAGALAKVFEASEFRAFGSHWRARRQVMRSVAGNRQTVLTELDRRVDVPFERYHVSQQFLRSE